MSKEIKVIAKINFGDVFKIGDPLTMIAKFDEDFNFIGVKIKTPDGNEYSGSYFQRLSDWFKKI